MTVRFLKPWNGYQPDQIATLAGGVETTLINAGIAAVNVASYEANASRTLSNADAGKTLDVTASGVTLTIPAGLTLAPGVIILSNTTTSIAFSGATGNGAGTTIVLSDNKVGTIIPTSVGNAYRVTGGV